VPATVIVGVQWGDEGKAKVLDALAAETGGRVIPCDLADRAAVERLAAEAGPVDVLVANAGVSVAGPVEAASIAEIDRGLDVNLRAPIVLARLMCRGMVERGGGHIVFISSLNGKVGTVRTSLYAATKFGLRGFAQSLREDMRPRGVGVSAIFPGFISDAGMHHDSGVKLPGYVGTKKPDDVARAVVRAIERNRAEIDVAPLGLRLGTTFASVAPEVAATVQRKLGADKVASQYEDAD
jgi:short-subunit dehydrogenase